MIQETSYYFFYFFEILPLWLNKKLAMSVNIMLEAPIGALAEIGLQTKEPIHYQLSPSELSEQTVKRNEGVLNDTGALVIKTGKFTGRSP